MNRLTEAVDFIRTETIDPANSHPNISESLKNKTEYTSALLGRFKRVGDLIRYFKRFEPTDGPSSELMTAIRDAGIPAFEDIHGEFMDRFGHFANDCTRIEDFVVGETYSSWDVIFYAGVYDARAGGILPIHRGSALEAIFIKAGFSGSGPYPNEWIEPGEVLKYYMKAISGNYNADYSVNKAIISSGEAPIYVFDKQGTECTLVGIFRYQKYVTEPGGEMWFRLVKHDHFDTPNLVLAETVHEDLERKIQESSEGSEEDRIARLENAPKTPKVRQTISTSYDRNPDVVAQVRKRANGICERCNQNAPFVSASTGKAYLEVHHVIMLADGGEDTIENALALCPNCHRELHFGINNPSAT